MPRLAHGAAIRLDAFHSATSRVSRLSTDVDLGFAAVTPVDPSGFDFMFPDLQNDAANLLPESAQTRNALIELGRAMRDTASESEANSPVPAIYTYLGQFIDHDITLETFSAPLPQLLDPGLVPLSVAAIRAQLKNIRTATLDLDSVYGVPAPRNGALMGIGRNTALNGTAPPTLRPAGRTDENDLPREPRDADPSHDRAALIGDPRNDENTIVSQLHLAFLKAHNAIVASGKSFEEARRLLRQHYQHLVLHDFLPRVADAEIVQRTIASPPRFYDAMLEPFFMPLEFSVAGFRFGHTMVRSRYDFNVNFNSSGELGTTPATLQLLFTFTALSGQLGDFDTLPDNWIIEWERFLGAEQRNLARRFDTTLVEPLFDLRDELGEPIAAGGGDGGRLAVRNLLRGYLLRMPTGQAVARALGVEPVSAADLEAAAGSDEQRTILRSAGFLDRTPLWFYILAEAMAASEGARLGPVGSTIVAEVLVGLVRRSEDSILRGRYPWSPTLGQTSGRFDLADLLRLAGVLREDTRTRAGGRAT